MQQRSDDDEVEVLRSPLHPSKKRERESSGVTPSSGNDLEFHPGRHLRQERPTPLVLQILPRREESGSYVLVGRMQRATRGQGRAGRATGGGSDRGKDLENTHRRTRA